MGYRYRTDVDRRVSQFGRTIGSRGRVERKMVGERQVDKEERHERFQMIMLTEQSFTMQKVGAQSSNQQAATAVARHQGGYSFQQSPSKRELSKIS